MTADRRVAPPSGHPPPTSAVLAGGERLDLVTMAQEVCRRYFAVFPDEQERYGDTGWAWCVHDNQHLIGWGAAASQGDIDMSREVAWLAKVLEARDFPLERLARNLDLAAEVVLDRLDGDSATRLANVLSASAELVRSRETFLD